MVGQVRWTSRQMLQAVRGPTWFHSLIPNGCYSTVLTATQQLTAPFSPGGGPSPPSSKGLQVPFSHTQDSRQLSASQNRRFSKEDPLPHHSRSIRPWSVHLEFIIFLI